MPDQLAGIKVGDRVRVRGEGVGVVRSVIRPSRWPYFVEQAYGAWFFGDDDIIEINPTPVCAGPRTL